MKLFLKSAAFAGLSLSCLLSLAAHVEPSTCNMFQDENGYKFSRPPHGTSQSNDAVGICQPIVRENEHAYFPGQDFVIIVDYKSYAKYEKEIRYIGKTSNIVRLVDIDDESSCLVVYLEFQAIRPGKVKLYTETQVEKGGTPFGNKVTFIDHTIRVRE